MIFFIVLWYVLLYLSTMLVVGMSATWRTSLQVPRKFKKIFTLRLFITITHDFHLDESKFKRFRPNQIWVDRGGKVYNRSMK